MTARNDLEALVQPRSIAIVGATERPDAWGHWLFRKLLHEGFPGAVYPINQRAQTILGQPAYATVSAVPGAVDLAIIAIPAAQVFETIRDCCSKGVQAGLIITAGFSEARQDSRAQEQEIGLGGCLTKWRRQCDKPIPGRLSDRSLPGPIRQTTKARRGAGCPNPW